MDSASSRLRWAGNTLDIEGSFEMARSIGGFRGEGNDLNYTIRLLLVSRTSSVYILSPLARIDSRPGGDHRYRRVPQGEGRSARDRFGDHGALNSVGRFFPVGRRSE